MNFSKTFLVFTLLSFSLFALAKVKLVSWSSAEGIKRFQESKAKVDFFTLANFFEGQRDGLICGPTTGAIILNSLFIRKDNFKELPKTRLKDELRSTLPKGYDGSLKKFTPRTFISQKASRIKSWPEIYGKKKNGKADYGLQLRQLHRVFKSHGVDSKLKIVNQSLTLKRMRKDFKSNLMNSGDYVVVNYARKTLGQSGGGHISPVAAYHEGSDSFLVMDVNPNKDNWVWVSARDLHQSMNSFDTIENRGYLLLTR